MSLISSFIYIRLQTFQNSGKFSLFFWGPSTQFGAKQIDQGAIKSHWLQISRIAGQVRKIENPETLPQERS